MNSKFKNLPYTHREGLVIDSIEKLRILTQDKFDWLHVVVSKNLFSQLELELKFPEYKGSGGSLVIHKNRIFAYNDDESELPPNSIINLEDIE